MNVQVSPGFRIMAGKAVFSIVLFVLVYLLILTSAIALSVLCVMTGFSLLAVSPNLVSFAVGIGLAGMSFLLLVFLFKFLFKKHTTDLSHLTEITRNQEPELFAFVEEIVREVNTEFLKKIFLSTDVNASVVYDYGFSSIFLQLKK